MVIVMNCPLLGLSLVLLKVRRQLGIHLNIVVHIGGGGVCLVLVEAFQIVAFRNDLLSLSMDHSILAASLD